MVYRKTEKILAQLEAKRASIIASAIDVIAKHGMDGLTTDAVAKRAGVAVGLLYHHFPDKTEIVAAVVQQLLERDLAAVKGCGDIGAAIPVFFHRVASNYRLMSEIGRLPAYRDGMKRELARLIRATNPAESPAVLAAVVYGAVLEAAGSGGRVEAGLTSALLKAIGAPSPQKAKTVA